MKLLDSDTPKASGINVGSASLVMVFAVLSLTIFAVLSLLTSNNEFKLANKLAISIENYYGADYTACGMLSDIEKNIENNEPINIDGVILENNISTFLVPIDEGQSLRVSADFQNNDIKILSWQVINTIPQNYDNSLNIWTGE